MKIKFFSGDYSSKESNEVWYKKTLWLGVIVLLVTLVLNIIFF